MIEVEEGLTSKEGGPMQENIWIQIFWVACVATAIVASVLATRRRRVRYIGRIAVGVLILLGGALFNAVNLALGPTMATLPTRRNSAG